MTQTFIRFDSVGDAVSWLQLDAEGNTAASGHGPLAEVAASLSNQHIVVLVPGAEVVMYRTAVPGQKRRLLAQAVPYALEEQLADDVETLHFAFGNIEADEVAVAVVSRDVLTAWLARLREAGIEAHALVPDYLSLPLEENSWPLLHQGDMLIVRSGEQAGAAMDAANAAVYLEMLVNEAADARPAAITLSDFTDAPLAIESLTIDVQRQTSGELPLTLMARGYDEHAAINLLQGPFSRSERMGQFWRPWRAALVMLLVWLGLQLTLSITDYQRLAAEKGSLHVEIENSYRDAFPEARKVVNPRVQMERGLKALRGGSAGAGGFSDLLGQVGQHLQAAANIELQRISYKTGVLDVSLLIADLQQLDQLKQKLAQGGQLQVEIQSASARGNQIDARLRIKGAS